MSDLGDFTRKISDEIERLHAMMPDDNKNEGEIVNTAFHAMETQSAVVIAAVIAEINTTLKHLAGSSEGILKELKRHNDICEKESEANARRFDAMGAPDMEPPDYPQPPRGGMPPRNPFDLGGE